LDLPLTAMAGVFTVTDAINAMVHIRDHHSVYDSWPRSASP